jgi:hypothetical protein
MPGEPIVRGSSKENKFTIDGAGLVFISIDEQLNILKFIVSILIRLHLTSQQVEVTGDINFRYLFGTVGKKDGRVFNWSTFSITGRSGDCQTV